MASISLNLNTGREVTRTAYEQKWDRIRLSPAIDPLIVFVVVFSTCMLGILLQPTGLLSSFWAANAVLLGLFVRVPSLATRLGWAAACLGYLGADLMMGSSLEKTGLLTVANMVGVVLGFVLFSQLDRSMLRMRHPLSSIYLLAITFAASTAAGLVGMIANPVLFQRDTVEGFFFWFISEFVNYLAVLPLMLTFNGFKTPASLKEIFNGLLRDPMRPLPALTCLLGAAIAPLVEGPAALVFPVPGLIWCALVYNIGTVAVLTFVVAAWTLISTSLHWVDMGFAVGTFDDLLSFRLGVSLVLLAPISIASVTAAHNASLHEAKAARAAAEKAMASRALLLATMAHELRSPLNSIVGLSGLLEAEPMGPLGNEKYREFAEHIRLSGTHLNDLVTDLLDTAKVEAGKTQMLIATTPSRAMIEQSMRLVAGLAMESQIDISIEEGPWPTVMADSRAIKQVMINLLSNAVKFSPRGSPIKVASKLDDGRLTISVRDFGCGIAAEELARLGRPYEQAGDQASYRQGTGLGLSLSMNLIAKHGGVLRLTSMQGAGTTASFDLELSPGATANDD